HLHLLAALGAADDLGHVVLVFSVCPPALVDKLLVLLPLAETEDTVAEPDGVSVAEFPVSFDQLVVDEGAAGGVVIGEHVAPAPVADAGVDLFHALAAEQTNVAGLGPADGDFVLVDNQLAAGAEAGLDAHPGFLQDHLGQPDEQADAGPKHDHAPGTAG